MKTLRSILLAALVSLVPGLAANASEHGMKDAGDIVDVATGAGQFQTLVTALKAADLVDTLRGEGPFTVFAPTDDAFAKLPEGTVDTLLEPANREKLRAILTYHVVPGMVMAGDAMAADSATTAQGGRLMLAVEDGTLRINDSASVVKADITASNGVIHVIDTVLMPE
ncbi:fasciclin domain-containing protein [Arhodomonas aquaeolei]|uniref:fasciclin domain-containing protein n=1 Tax=Arhodomonas aquaeolei TaxID=2369 RepID=UPI002167AC1E|nr:fasciclin domain-containing protein [Arhodomonas aquaeolei]MCS4502851.1 fasciclin domain-containing protein [Arhodomonas aquaeolei]